MRLARALPRSDGRAIALPQIRNRYKAEEREKGKERVKNNKEDRKRREGKDVKEYKDGKEGEGRNGKGEIGRGKKGKREGESGKGQKGRILDIVQGPPPLRTLDVRNLWGCLTYDVGIAFYRCAF